MDIHVLKDSVEVATYRDVEGYNFNVQSGALLVSRNGNLQLILAEGQWTSVYSDNEDTRSEYEKAAEYASQNEMPSSVAPFCIELRNRFAISLKEAKNIYDGFVNLNL